MAEDMVRDVYERLGELLEEGDDTFIEKGPAVLQEAMDDPAFRDGLVSEHAEPGDYTRTKIIGDEGRHVIRYMEWPPGYTLIPHEHNGRPCFEVLDEGHLIIADIDAQPVDGEDDLYRLQHLDSYTVDPGDVGIIDPREHEIHAVYSPLRSRSVHVYPEDAVTCDGYVLADDADFNGDVYRRETFQLREE